MKKFKNYRGYFALFCLSGSLLLLNSCDPKRVFEQNQQIKDYQWNYSDPKTFSFDITDTTLHYNLYINIRHSFLFEWRNVYVQIETVFPDKKVLNKRVNLLFSEANGEWFGHCLGDNCDLQVVLQEHTIFPQKGKYTFHITQDMRANPLPLVKSIGMRVEKDFK